MTEKRPMILVAALIHDRDRKSVLLTRHDGHRRWHFPDGELNPGERIVEAVTRSLKEDLGLLPAEVDDRFCLPTDTILLERGFHAVTLHFPVHLPAEPVFAPKIGLEMRWQSLGVRAMPGSHELLTSTAEVLHRLVEDGA